MKTWGTSALASAMLAAFSVTTLGIGEAAAQYWKYNRPAMCKDLRIPPGKRAHARHLLWTKQGAAMMEGQWQHECRYAFPGNANVLAVYQYNWAWIWVECYIPDSSPCPMTGPPPRMGF